jgi:hypothetical protein
MYCLKRVVSSLLAFGFIVGGGFTTPGLADDQTPPSISPSPAASEAHKRGKEKIKQACGDDVKRFCEGVTPGEGRIVQCLEEHAKDLSQDCSKILEKRAQKKGAGPKVPQQ